MASSRVTLSVDREHYRAARKAAQRMDTTVSRLTDLFFQSIAAPATATPNRKVAALRGAFRSAGLDDRKVLVASLRAKHFK
ncbi:MAG: hypothetical protein AAB214_00270 [Fibrobacterota bacterium]